MATQPSRAPQSFTGAFGVDVFISYGHIDNQANWVTHFHTALQMRLQELLGTDRVVIWRDVKLNGIDAFEVAVTVPDENSLQPTSDANPRGYLSPKLGTG